MSGIILTNFNLLDGTDLMYLQQDKSLVIKDGLIQDILDTSDLKKTGREKYGTYRVINLKGQYLMPGLINMHVHLALEGNAPKAAAGSKPVNYKALYKALSFAKPVREIFRNKAAGYAKTHLFSGTTTIRTVGGIMDFDSTIRDEINKGHRVGPRILCANTAVSVPGGHFAGSLGTEASTPEEAAADVRKIAATNPDLIKIMITGGVMDCKVVGEPGEVKMTPEQVRAACEQAHLLGLKVAAHTESPEGVKLALENGVDTIEHGAHPDEEMIRLFKEKKAVLIATLSPGIPYALFDREVSHCTEIAQINGKALLRGMIECVNACLAAGIPVGIGTDCSCPFITHYNLWRELVYLQKYCGMTPAQLIKTITLGNARIAGIDSVTGSIEIGKSADMIVVKDNPLENLHTLRQVNMVIMKGRIFDHPKFKKLADVDKALDDQEKNG